MRRLYGPDREPAASIRSLGAEALNYFQRWVCLTVGLLSDIVRKLSVNVDMMGYGQPK